VKPGVVVDRASLLALVDGRMTLGACEDALGQDGLTLGLDALDRTLEIGAWLAGGAHGARDPWTDPADHLVAGLDATLRDGRQLSIRPAPRRAVGPDLIALIVGMAERYARVDRAWLRVHPRGASRPAAHPLTAERNPPLTDAETALLQAMDQALRT
jgi:alkyldihydroxyacetonephosphate synthase